MEDIFNLMKKDFDFLDDYFFSSKDFFRGFNGPNMEQLSLFKETENSYDAEIKVGEIVRDTLNVEVDDEKHLIYISYSRETHEGNLHNRIIETVPNNSDINRINASYDNSILKISIPKNKVIDDDVLRIFEEGNNEQIEGEIMKFKEVKRKENVTLLEASTKINGNPCTIQQLNYFFPEYEFSEDKEYYIKINGSILDGDSVNEFIKY